MHVLGSHIPAWLAILALGLPAVGMAIASTTHFLGDRLPLFSQPFQRQVLSSAQDFAINATTTIAVTVPSLRCGQIRFKALSYPDAGAGQLTKLKVTGSDGTNTVLIALQATLDASDLPDFIFNFFTDQPLTSISFAGTMANVANGKLRTDINIVGNQ